jgi:hypothetical protein
MRSDERLIIKLPVQYCSTESARLLSVLKRGAHDAIDKEGEMNRRSIVRPVLKIVLMLAGAAVYGNAQWVNYPTPGIPRTHDGKPNLSAPAPRASDGKPDLSGLWQVEPTPLPELTRLFGDLSAFSVPGDDVTQLNKYAINTLADFKPDEAPMRPHTAAVLRQQQNTPSKNPCLPAGFPFIYLLPYTFKVIQAPGLIAVLQEFGWNFRQIYTDRRKPPADPQPLWQGYSVGKWEADTLVVDTTGFNDKTSLDAFGHPHSEALHLTEHFRRRDFGHLDVEVTKPFTIKFTDALLPDTDILEFVCEENEKDVQHLRTRQ